MESSTTTLRPRASALSLRLDSVLVAVLGFALAAGPAAWNGGYFAASWSWVALGTFSLATIRLILVPRVGLGRLDWALILLLASFTGWLALSGLWSPALTPTLTEVVRSIAYLGAVLLALLLVRRGTVAVLLGSLLAGVTAVSGYALLTRLLPDRLGSWTPVSGYRLADPIGYWNGLGVYAAMGTLLAVGLVARSHSRVVRALAGAAPPILVTTMLFTFSRGAWLALGVGLVVAFAVDPRRLQLAAAALALAPWSAALLIVAAGSDSLTKSSATLAQVTDDGHQFLRLVVAMAVLSAVAAVVFGEVGDRVAVPRGARRAFALALAVLALAGVAVAWSSEGPPWKVADRAWQRFSAPPKETGANVTSRLFDLSSTGRVDLWRVSVDQFETDRLKGGGAGSFKAVWFQNRPNTLYSQEGHSLYTETLGELGIVGLALLVAFLAAPLAAAVRRRRDPLVAVALAPYAAFLAHAGVDWDWELAGITLVALLAGAALVVTARGDSPRDAPSALRYGFPVVTGALAVLSVFLVLAYVPLQRAEVANRQGRFTVALEEANNAVRFAPWSSAALQQRGRAERGLGQFAGAQADFRRALTKTPNDYELWTDYAGVVQGKAALAAIERAVALNPRDPLLPAYLKALRASAASS